MVSVASLKYSSIKQDVHFENYCPIWSKRDDKAGYALGHCYLLIDKSLPQRILWCSVRSNQDRGSNAYPPEPPSRPNIITSGKKNKKNRATLTLQL